MEVKLAGKEPRDSEDEFSLDGNQKKGEEGRGVAEEPSKGTKRYCGEGKRELAGAGAEEHVAG